jgi:hypothetical protein
MPRTTDVVFTSGSPPVLEDQLLFFARRRAEPYRLSTSATGTVLIRMKLYQCSGNGSGCIIITRRDDRVADLKNSSTI